MTGVLPHTSPDGAGIIVVEDDPLIRANAVEILEEAGFDVVEAPDAATALDVISSRPDIRVLFTDVNMPGRMSGLDLAREVHGRWPAVLLLVTSGRRMIPTREIPDSGQFLGKPYGAAQLVEQVQALFHDHAEA